MLSLDKCRPICCCRKWEIFCLFKKIVLCVELFTEIVDNVLADDDIDDDGFLTYPEYIIARRREEAREMQDELESKSNTNRQRN